MHLIVKDISMCVFFDDYTIFVNTSSIREEWVEDMSLSNETIKKIANSKAN